MPDLPAFTRNLGSLPSPCFVIDLGLLENNLRVLDGVQQRTGAKILIALKAFSAYHTFPLVKKYLHGACASSPHEARLGAEEIGKEVHAAAPAYTAADMQDLVKHATTIIFNSFSQWDTHKAAAQAAGRRIGIRVNPECASNAPVELYDPCARFSRLGVTRKNFEGRGLSGITGLHVHALCQQNSDALQRVMAATEEKFGDVLPNMDWVNFGGGHHITRKDYDVDLLCDLLIRFRDKYKVQVYLEPGEAVALNAGFLVATVLDLIDNEKQVAVLDTSAETHMPDVLAMPYRPEIIGAGKDSEKKYNYRLGGLTCLAGDVIGDYSFDAPLKQGSQLVFTDMAIYSMVKTTTFNGVNLPSIATHDPATGETKIVRRFGYEDFKSRL